MIHPSFHKYARRSGLLGLALLAGALATPVYAQAPDRITGVITYRQRIALTRDATAEVRLLDVSRADAAATVVARQVIDEPGQVPIRFRLSFDPDDIRPRRRYAVDARITDRGEVRFRTPRPVPVLTGDDRGDADLELVLQPVGGEPEPLPEAEPAPGQATTSTYRRVSETRRSGGVTSTYVAHFVDGEIMRIDETQDQGEAGSSTHRYYFEQDDLVFYRGTGRVGAVGREGRPGAVSVTMVFDPDGMLTLGERTVGGTPRRPTAREVDTVLNRARRLAEDARAQLDREGNIAADRPENRSPAGRYWDRLTGADGTWTYTLVLDPDGGATMLAESSRGGGRPLTYRGTWEQRADGQLDVDVSRGTAREQFLMRLQGDRLEPLSWDRDAWGQNPPRFRRGTPPPAAAGEEEG